MAKKNTFTSETAREAGRKGAKKRAENIRAKKQIKKLAKNDIATLWNKPIAQGKLVDIEQAESMADIYGHNITQGQRVICELFKKANKGNVAAINLLFECMGFLDKEMSIDIEPEINFNISWPDEHRS